jgi:hypothetical protein
MRLPNARASSHEEPGKAIGNLSQIYDMTAVIAVISRHAKTIDYSPAAFVHVLY